jgi:homoserine kinase
MQTFTVRVPATTANLGPGFDCLGMALDLWNQVTFSRSGRGVKVEIHGEGEDHLPKDDRNMIAQAVLRVYRKATEPPPYGLAIACENRIPLGSGLGSSAAAILSGMMGANALIGCPFSPQEILHLASEMEGHPDNMAAAQAGGLVAVTRVDGQELVQGIRLPDLKVVVVVPQFHLPTRLARAALPAEISHRDAAFNIGRALFVIEALRQADLDLLAKVLDDRLHQPYRLPLVPGAEAALQAARSAGSAAAISGAGPSLIAFPPGEHDRIGSLMVEAFRQARVAASYLILQVSPKGAAVSENGKLGEK